MFQKRQFQRNNMQDPMGKNSEIQVYVRKLGISQKHITKTIVMDLFNEKKMDILEIAQ